MLKSLKRVPRRPVVTASDKVRVVVRVRPHAPSAVASNKKLRELEGPELAVSAAANTVENFRFDRVFDSTATSADVFDDLLPTVDAWLEGYNGCIFAYGQTGSGKTHTMLGPDGGLRDLDGVIPRTVAYALEQIATEEAASLRLDPNTLTSHRVRATYVEIYNNELRDLLIGHDAGAPGGDDAGVSVREDPSGRVFLSGATEVTVKSAADLLALVAYGARRRATGRTNMNEHSSRSHAVLTLHHQHRWKPADDVAGKRLKQTDAALHLVDLAGSEYAKRTGNTGEQLKESAAINTGLFALGNVIAALAGHRSRRVGSHIPYRDSLLTRLLQSALGGDSRTVMLVCCSPAPADVAESVSSLRYAADAMAIESRPRLQLSDFVPAPQPMDQDIVDPSPDLDRRTVWLEVPGFGDVYCRCVGDPDVGELMLFVHGSGSDNSSIFWNELIFELAVREHATPYYMVAIDCPGYGKSPGDRQTIRSLPGQFLTAVVNALGFRQALCLLGCSQGSASCFNAVLENPSITRHVAVVHPVAHDVFRFKAIQQSCLLVFDTEDAGHPVKVGRWMRDNLPNCTYFEFTMSQEPYWPADHVAVEVIKLVEGGKPSSGAAGSATQAVRRLASRFADGAVTALQRLAGGLFAWCEHQNAGAPMKTIDLGVLGPPSHELAANLGEDQMRELTLSDAASTRDATASNDAEGSCWVGSVDARSGRVYYTNVDTLEVMWRRPRHGDVIEAEPPTDAVGAAADENGEDGDAAATADGRRGRPQARPSTNATDASQRRNGSRSRSTVSTAQAPPPTAAKSLFDDDEDRGTHGDNAKVQLSPEEEAKNAADRLAAEVAETSCGHCAEPLPADAGLLKRFRDCRHVVCSLCFERTSRYLKRCPVCHLPLASVPQNVKDANSLVESVDAPVVRLHATKLSEIPECVAQEEIVTALVAERRTCARIVIEYGNTAAGQPGGAMCVEAFAKLVSVYPGAWAKEMWSLGMSSLACVAFDINPDFPKSAVKATSAPFTLKRTMATQFTCAMTVTFKGVPALPPITIPYTIRHEPETRRRVVVYVHPSHGPQTKSMSPAQTKAWARPRTVDVERTIELFV